MSERKKENVINFENIILQVYFKCEPYHDEKSSLLDYVLFSRTKNKNFCLPLYFLLPVSILLAGPSSPMEESISCLELQVFFDG